MIIIMSFIVLFVITHQKKVLEQKNIISANESAYQRELVKASLIAAEEERARMASNLHDDTGVLLTAIKQRLQLAAKDIREERPKRLLDESASLLNTATQQVRNISNELVPSTVAKLGLMHAMQELCDNLSSESLHVDFINGTNDPQLSMQKGVNLYRILSESINNIIKHGAPSDIQLTSAVIENKLVLTILHNGKGLTNADVAALTEGSKGLGLKNIAARAQLTGSEINYAAEPHISKVSIETPIA
jgi:two-component system NarL family sensor kinase